MVDEVLCYNRGCGQKYCPSQEDGKVYPEGEGKTPVLLKMLQFQPWPQPGPCRFHPGAPYFHDAYKGWSCCGKKATDFTEFLNFPGCTKGRHSRDKPVEPEKITGNLSKVPDEPQVQKVQEVILALFRGTLPNLPFRYGNQFLHQHH